jgi:hypothetical protein
MKQEVQEEVNKFQAEVEIGINSYSISGDISDFPDIHALFDAIVKKFGDGRVRADIDLQGERGVSWSFGCMEERVSDMMQAIEEKCEEQGWDYEPE